MARRCYCEMPVSEPMFSSQDSFRFDCSIQVMARIRRVGGNRDKLKFSRLKSVITHHHMGRAPLQDWSCTQLGPGRLCQRLEKCGCLRFHFLVDKSRACGLVKCLDGLGSASVGKSVRVSNHRCHRDSQT